MSLRLGCFEAGDQRAGQVTAAHVSQGRGVDEIAFVAGAQELEEVEPALGEAGGKVGEGIVADLRGDAVAIPVPGAGVVDADPRRGLQPGAQHRLALVGETLLALIQEPQHLALGDIHPEVAQQARQALRRALALVIEGQQESA